MTDRRLIGIDASRSYREPMTGTERYSRRIIEQLMALETAQMDYRLYFNQPPPASAATGIADIRTIPARRFWTHYRLSRELREHPVDLLFVPAHVLPLKHPDRSVVTIHDLGYLSEPDAHTWTNRVQIDLTTSWNAKRATHLLAISESTRADLIQHYQVDPDRITVVRHGIDQTFRQLPRDEVERYRSAARLPASFILYLGTIQPRKNLVRLIIAFEKLASVNPDVHLILGGNPGWKSAPIRERAGESVFKDRIRFLGHVPEEQLSLLYGASSAFALPSLYEGFGLPVLEAMACGVPAVMSNRGALPELAGADAAVVDPLDTDEIAEAITNASQQRWNADAILNRIYHAAAFSWESSARSTRNVLWNVLSQ